MPFATIAPRFRYEIVAKENEESPALPVRQPASLATLKTHAAAVGLSWKKVAARLPDWAEDAWEHEAGRIELEGFIAKHFGFRIRQGGGFEPAQLPQALFKSRRGAEPDEMRSARSYATAVSRALAQGVTAPWAPLTADPAALRTLALAQSGNRRCVDFEALVEASWQGGVPVLHLPDLPVDGKKPDGMVTFVAGRPVVVLLKAAKLAEWMVFILGHELGHIAMGHLGSQDGDAIVDAKVSLAEEGETQPGQAEGADAQEAEANAYASGVLVPGGFQITLGNPPWPMAERLADFALAYGREHEVSPGHAVLNAANHSPRGGKLPFALGNKTAQVLATRLGTPTTAETCRAAARRHLDLAKLRPDTVEFLEKLEAI